MCGIAGCFWDDAVGDEAFDIVRGMARTIAHRGPDDEGVWGEAQSGIALAHRRLSIVDLSPAGHQPMISRDGRYVIVFNGEIYNHASLRAELSASVHDVWHGHSDTEVLLAGISQWGLQRTLEKSVGMFAIALWDRRDHTLALARDRIGEKPLYFGRLSDCLVFSSEIKALRSHPEWRQDIDRNSLALLMRHNYIPAPYTIYKDVAKVRPGHIVWIKARQPTRSDRYWDAAEVALQGMRSPFKGSASDAVEALDGLLRNALADQMLADVPLGAFLSGGVDSSTVVALMQTMNSRPIRTFSIGFDVADYNEAEHARKVAEHLGTDHTELHINEHDALQVIPKLPSIYCEPFADSSQIPTYLVALLAKQKVTVALSGDGGDELFSGYARYDLVDRFWSKISSVPSPVRRSLMKIAKCAPPAAYDRALGPVFRMLPSAWLQRSLGDKIHKAAQLLSLDSVDDVYLRACSHWPQPEDLVLGSRESATILTGIEPLPVMPDNVRRMMYMDLLSYLPDDILVKVDRAAMAASLETRVPMLDHRIIEFAMSLPLSILRANGTAKWPLRQILYRHVPRKLVDRPKMGFGVPIDKWLRGPLRDWADGLLDESRLRREGYFSASLVRQAWQEHLSGRRNNQYQLWNVLMFQAWSDATLGGL
jgi:asparagine synthase (glutamine-hydrolysing)